MHMFLARSQEEEDYLINLMREEEIAERRQQEAQAQAAKREAAKQEMLAANAYQLHLKVRGLGLKLWLQKRDQGGWG